MKIFLGNIFRISNWWNYIFPPILGIAYLTILTNQGNLAENWFTLIMFFISFLFTASFGFFLNDITDIEEDTKANKQNFSSKLSPRIRYSLLITILLFAIIPWFYIKNLYPSILFFVMQVSLLFLYSVKPFRVKQYPFLAILADTLYSSFVPALIALLLFNLKLYIFPYSYIFVLIMFFLRGLRNIMVHQIIDAKNDIKTNTNTLVIVYGEKIVYKILSFVLLPLEIVLISLLCVFLILNLRFSWLIIPMLIVFYAIKLFDAKAEKNKTLKMQIINDFYEDILPFTILILLSIQDIYFIIILIIHVIIFRNKVLWLILPWVYYKLFYNNYAQRIFRILRKK